MKAWESTNITYLFRYVPTGEYVLRRRRGKSDERIYLKTTVFSVAKWKMPAILKGWRQAASKSAQSVSGLAEDWVRSQEASPALKASSKAYLRHRLTSLIKSWPGLKDLAPHKVGESDVAGWAERYSAKYSPSNYNNTLMVLRNAFNLAMERGDLASNPAARIRRRGATTKVLRLPSAQEFSAVVAEIRNAGGRFSGECANLVEFLAYSGLRVFSEAANVTWGDIDLAAGQIIVRGSLQDRTKNSETRVVPIIPELAYLLARLKKNARVSDRRPFRVRECQKALTRACSKAGVERMTHNDLRHLFATRCLSSGVDVPTVAQWMGHKDGGALMLKTYSHVLQSHSLAMAKRVRVSSLLEPDPKDHGKQEDNQPANGHQGERVEDLSHGSLVTHAALVVQ